MKHHDLFDRGLKRVRSVLSLTGKSKCSRPYSLGSTSTPEFDFVDVGSDSESWEKANMGKSNKFDYTNRANGGAKLGDIIGRDAQKEADKVVRGVEKQVRKLSIGSSVSGTSSSDLTEAVVHTLDIKAPSKQLGDEGACAMAAGLEIALKKGTTSAAVLLEDLNLSDNGITTVTLARLGPVIEAARYDLKTINLANNNIRVENNQQVAEWTCFLRSFRHCLKLRRLDFSGNTNLGPRALEIFARVHCQEPQINTVSPYGNASVRSLCGFEEVSIRVEAPTSTCFNDVMTKGRVMKRRCGLRGIPFITLTDVGLTDAGALWLSYVLEDHHYPIQLIDTLNATIAGSAIQTYAQQSASGGLDWDMQEPALGRDGLHLLKKTETIRKQIMLDDGSVMESSMIEDREVARAGTGDQRASIRSIATTDGGEHELSEVESLRKKLQRRIIAGAGAANVELWRAGLRIAISSTVLSGIGPSVRDQTVFYAGPPIFQFASRGSGTPQPMTPIRNGKSDWRLSSGDYAYGSPQPNGSLRQGTYAQTLTINTSPAPGDPGLAITEATNSPTTPKMIFKPHRKGTFSDGSDFQIISQKLDGLVERDEDPRRFVRWQEAIIDGAGGSTAFRNPNVPSHIPQRLLDRIACYTISEQEVNLLSTKQRREACAWGQNRSNFNKTESWRKMPDSSQVWSLLESIDCLSYQSE